MDHEIDQQSLAAAGFVTDERGRHYAICRVYLELFDGEWTLNVVTANGAKITSSKADYYAAPRREGT